MSDVFVSYAHEDRDNVLSLVTRLQHHGIDIWIDRYKIAGGSNFGQEIIEGIKACKTVLLMASDRALSSDAVLREVTFATEKGRRIIPLVIQSPLTETDRTGFWLAGLHRIEATGEFDQWSEALFRALRAANVIIQEGSDVADQPAKDTSVITCLMAHLADRAEQERQIFLGLERHLESRPSRPLVLVVHGRATQCIDEFIRRLFLHTLPNQFARLKLPNQLWCDLVPWPGQLTRERRDAAKERAKVYRFNLTQRLGLRPSETMVAVHAQLSRKRCPVALWSLIPSEHWQAEEPHLIREVMHLWSELPDMSQPFVMPLVVAYRESDRSLLSRWLARDPAWQIRETVVTLETAGPRDLDIIVLPELADITRAECEYWIRDVLRPTNIALAMQQLKQSFDDERLAPEQGLPMERLVPMLNRLVPPGATLRGL